VTRSIQIGGHRLGARLVSIEIPASEEALASSAIEGALARGLLCLPSAFGNMRNEEIWGVNSSCRPTADRHGVWLNWVTPDEKEEPALLTVMERQRG
jgi:hypothetical protein